MIIQYVYIQHLYLNKLVCVNTDIMISCQYFLIWQKSDRMVLGKKYDHDFLFVVHVWLQVVSAKIEFI